MTPDTSAVAIMVILIMCVLSLLVVINAPRLTLVLAFLSTAPCVLMPLFAFVLWPGILCFGAGAVWHWSRGAYGRKSPGSELA